MNRLLICWLFAFALAGISRAGTISLAGALNPIDPNAVVVLEFALSTDAPLTIQSWGYGGTADAPAGRNAAGEVIAPGGFDSYVSLFTGWGPDALFLASADDGVCPPAHADPACLDAAFSSPLLRTGRYTLVLSVYENISRAEDRGTGALGDGFTGGGSYFDAVSGRTRTPAYAVDVSSAALVPEPVSVGLAGLCLVAIRIRCVRRRR